ncbi:hypothetical protein GCM10010388_06450 [Streptomyces mauvecolor]
MQDAAGLVGSTPTAHAAEDRTGVTELRADNYVFFDLVMAGIGVCRIEDLALSVVVTVIGHRPAYGWIVTDGARLPDLPIGTRLRILPNHACATAAQHHGYHVINSTRTTNTAPEIQDFWRRVTGW